MNSNIRYSCIDLHEFVYLQVDRTVIMSDMHSKIKKMYIVNPIMTIYKNCIYVLFTGKRNFSSVRLTKTLTDCSLPVAARFCTIVVVL